ncbi:MAG TPA: heavy metal sensor histidine kinase [Pyrinomonadaceae bacterium]|jgi:heavy metal sensor kinase|nr:heavy metal sensor histidine kinase [Pyrinomonadaceae bacterium]
MIFNTIRIRLTLWFTAILALVLLTFVFSTYFFLDYTIRRQTDRTLRELSTSFTDVIESEEKDSPSEDGTDLGALNEALEDLRFRNYQILVFDSQNKLISPAEQPPNKTSIPAEQITGTVTDFSRVKQNSAFYTLPSQGIDFRIFARTYPLKGQTLNIFIAHPLSGEYEVLGRFRNILLVSVPLVLILASLGGYFLARKSLSPVAAMTRSAAEIGAANLNARLPVKNDRDELGNLAVVFNLMLERLENSFEQQRRFMADASHELRTPLAIVRGESEVALSRADRSQGELRESLEVVSDESKRLTRIVEDLFTLARADAGQFRTNFRDLYLDEILTDCVRKIRVLADERNISIDISAEEFLTAGDEQLLHRLFINLLDNAIKYNREAGKVTVVGKKTSDGYQITVSDTGKGILPEEQARIFERFYRADKARSRSNGTANSGAGLGLSIAGWIAEIHHGKIELLSSNENGSTFILAFALPLKSSQ